MMRRCSPRQSWGSSEGRDIRPANQAWKHERAVLQEQGMLVFVRNVAAARARAEGSQSDDLLRRLATASGLDQLSRCFHS
mmetsp:Transcript_123895/g.344840  ORF Transcript_123895/g.344840 Transcript_123895/m.344840 type:complete len:80 (-) Transcript_123895:30-269(-)